MPNPNPNPNPSPNPSLVHALQSSATQPAHAPHRRRLPPPPGMLAALRPAALGAAGLRGGARGSAPGGARGPHSAVSREVVRRAGWVSGAVQPGADGPVDTWLGLGLGLGSGSGSGLG